MFEPILMGLLAFFHKCLSAEKSHMNVETEAMTYCCDGWQQGESKKIFWEWGCKKHFGGELAKRNLRWVVFFLFWGQKFWERGAKLFLDGITNNSGGWGGKSFEG